MKTLLILLVLIAAFIVAGIVLFVYRMNRVVTSSKETQYGPFVIKAEASTAKTFNINYGMVDQTTVRYSIWFDGKPIQFPQKLHTNTGLPFLWKVYALTDAKEPTLLAGSQSLYLIYLKEGKPFVEPLVVQGSDFASLQFLDSNEGHPGKRFEVIMSSDADGMEKVESLNGGKLLLVSDHLVYDVVGRKKWLVNQSNQPIDNYFFPAPQGVIALSPDKKSVVFRGVFESWNTKTEDLPDSEHAIVVYDFEQDTGYVVKYDDTETRMANADEIDIHWLHTYFEWKKAADASDRLQLRTLEKPTPWRGRYKESDHYYYLYPVKASMLPVFLDFVLSQMNWNKSNILSDDTGQYAGRQMVLGDARTKLDIVFKEDEQQICFSKHSYVPSDPNENYYPALVKRIADAFNAELSEGKYQMHFGKIISETKRIRSL